MKLKARLPVASNRTATVGTLAGIITAFAISLILVAAITGLVTGNKFPEGSLGLPVFIVRTVAVLVGALVGTGLAKEKCIVTVGIITAGYLVLLLGLGIVMYNGSFKSFGSGLLSTIAGGAVGCLIRLKLQNRPKRGRKIRA